jgi:hypothetical protein
LRSADSSTGLGADSGADLDLPACADVRRRLLLKAIESANKKMADLGIEPIGFPEDPPPAVGKVP